MQRGHFVALLVIAGVALSPALVLGQAADPSAVPRTAWGKPDLGGVWDFRTLTPMERPKELGERAQLTEVEAAARVARAREQTVDRPPPPGNPGGYNRFWFDDPGFVDNERTSLIVDPPNGRIPALRADVPRQVGSLSEDVPLPRPIRYRSGGSGTTGPEDRGLAERCILGFNAGPPLLPGGYNQNIQLFQTPDHVVVYNEMVHDVRIVPLDGRPHLPARVRQWLGDGRGYWDGDTLVIETTNFTDKTASFNPSVMVAMGTGETLRLTERFTRIGADVLLYEFTVNDPVTFTRPFSGSFHMRRSDEKLFEYACHEGNYGLWNILSGARKDEQAAAGDPKEQSR